MAKIKIPKKLFRSFASDEVKVDEESRTVEFAFSSELPVDRWFGREILSHAPGCMIQDRLNDAAPLLFNHDMDAHIGVIEKSWIGNDKRGYVKVRFGRSALAQEKLDDVRDGILRNVSFGYMIDEMILTKKGADNEPSEYTATKYQPYEVSFVTVAADNSVGLGRSADGTGEVELDIAGDDETKQETAGAPASIGEKTMETPVDLTAVRAAAVTAERDRTAAITALGEKFDKRDLARQLIEGGKSVGEAQSAFLEQLGFRQVPVSGTEGEIGLTNKEVRAFSFLRAVQALMNPADQRFQAAAAFEREVSIAAQKAGNKTANGFLVPMEILRAGRRDLTVGTATAGGHTVAEELLAASFIDLLRKKSVLQRAGAMMLSGLTSDIAIPRLTSAATAYWIAESGAVTESAQAFDQVTMAPKGLGAFTDYSRKLMLQSSFDVESLVRSDLAKVIALEIDRAAFYGSGASNQVTGVKNVSGINTVNLAAATPTYLEIISMETAIAADNAEVESMKYLLNATGRGALKGVEKFSGAGQPVWEAGNTVNGYATEVSNQVEAGDYWFGNFADIMLGMWSGLDIMVDPYAGATSGTVRVIALQDVDIAVRHPESFCRAADTL